MTDRTFAIRPHMFMNDTRGMSDNDMARIYADIKRLLSNPHIDGFGLRGQFVGDDDVAYYGVGVTRYAGDNTIYLWNDYSRDAWAALL